MSLFAKSFEHISCDALRNTVQWKNLSSSNPQKAGFSSESRRCVKTFQTKVPFVLQAKNALVVINPIYSLEKRSIRMFKYFLYTPDIDVFGGTGRKTNALTLGSYSIIADNNTLSRLAFVS